MYYTVNPQYNEKTVWTNRTLNVLFVCSDSITIKNADDIEDDFPDDKRPAAAVVHDSLTRAFPREYAKRKLKVLCAIDTLPAGSFAHQSDTAQFEYINRHIAKGDTTNYRFAIPKKQTLIDAGLKPDIGIIINKLTMGRNYSMLSYGPTFLPGNTISTPRGTFSTPGMMMGSGGGSSESLDAMVQYVIWDYQNACEISYGNIPVSTSFFWVMTHNTWKDEFQQIAWDILKQSPLKAKPRNDSW